MFYLFGRSAALIKDTLKFSHCLDDKKVYKNNKYNVYVVYEGNGLSRISVKRKKPSADNNVIPWDDLQEIKSQVGFRRWYAVEIYPQAFNEVDIDNARHLWVLPIPLKIGWKK